jgi:hypothetical protein
MDTKTEVRVDGQDTLCTRAFAALIGMLAVILAAALLTGGSI